MYSITKLAIVAVTGDPMAQPNILVIFLFVSEEAVLQDKL